MPRGTRDSASPGTRRRRSTPATTGPIVAQISQIVAANETLQRQNAELRATNDQLRTQLADIGSALGRLTGSPRRGRGRGAVEIPGQVEVKPKRQRRPITDPVLLAKRAEALTKARAARAAKLAAARAQGNGSTSPGEE